jgi:hypothetical protein
MKTINNIKQSLTTVKTKPFYLFAQIVLDLLFLVLIGVFGNMILSKSIPFLEKMAVLNQGTQTVTSLASDEASAMIIQQTQMLSLLSKVLGVFIKFIAVVFILWIILQGLNWFLAVRSDRKISLKKYLLKFSIISLISTILIVILTLLFVNFSIKNLLTLTPIISQSLINNLMIAITIIIVYFTINAYSILDKHNLRTTIKRSFKVGVKNFKEIIIAYLILVILFTIANYIVKLFALLGFTGLMISGIIVIMPLIAFSRIYLIKTINTIE